MDKIYNKSFMSTIIFPSPIFGPVHSRRLGVSLGINLLPSNGKVCNFDCIYCECGYNANHRTHIKCPSRKEVYEALEKKLQEMKKDGPIPDVFTFAGNGEPTIHPEFAGIINDTIALRDIYFPKAKVSVLSNSTLIHRAEVFNALCKVDNNILKLDTIDSAYIDFVNRPTSIYDIDSIVEKMCEFKGHIIIQTMFIKGFVQGKNVDNTLDEYVFPWLKKLEKIKPEQVMIYTIDRDTPDKELKKVSKEELDHIVELIEEIGIKASASY